MVENPPNTYTVKYKVYLMSSNFIIDLQILDEVKAQLNRFAQVQAVLKLSAIITQQLMSS